MTNETWKEDYTCSCGIYVHPKRVRHAYHMTDCPYAPPQEKIHIEDVYTAFVKFQQDTAAAKFWERNSSVSWKQWMAEARDKFKKDIGFLANLIDWTEK